MTIILRLGVYRYNAVTSQPPVSNITVGYGRCKASIYIACLCVTKHFKIPFDNIIWTMKMLAYIEQWWWLRYAGSPWCDWQLVLFWEGKRQWKNKYWSSEPFLVLKICIKWDNKPSSLRINWLYLIGLLLRLGMRNEICQYIQSKLHVYRHYFHDRLDVRNYNYSYDSRNYTIAILKGCLLIYTNGRQPSYWFLF